MKIIRLLAFLTVFVSASFAHAQSSVGTISGYVTDPSNSAVSEAKVTVTDEKTGRQRQATTNQTGGFTVVQLPPSIYTIEILQPGFANLQARGIVLQVGQEIKQNFVLHVQSEQSTVTVQANGVNLDTANAAIGANIPNREIQELPINGRQISQLYLLVPGASNAGSGTFGDIRFSGRAVEQNIIRLDGIEATSIIDTTPGNLNGELGSLFRLQQSLEAVQEFRVDSSSYPAELGTGTGGQISFITKSGGNAVHGSAFEYVRNDYFDARNRFNPKGVGNPKFRLNQFGGSVGGPILKDKLFFFATYEGLRQIWAAPQSAATLSNYAKSTIPTSSAVYPLLAAFPADPFSLASELPSAGNPTGILSRAVTTIGTNNIQEDFGDIRFDYHINDRFSMYARYNIDQGNSSQIQDLSLSKFGQVSVPQNAVLAFNQVWTPRIFNETKFGYNGIKMRVLGIPGASPNADISKARISVAGLTNVGALISLSSSFNGVGAPYTGQSYSYIDNLSYVVGNHSMKFGAEIRPLSLYNNQIGGTTYTYNSIGAFQTNSPAQIQFFGDLSDQSPFTGLSGDAQVKQAYYIGYAQDEWKLRQNLTLSYGLRYEYYSPLHEVRDKVVVFDMTAGTILPKYPGDWYASSKANFGPRLGLTWAPNFYNGDTIFRLGGGVYYGPGQTEDQIQPEANDRVSRTFTSGKVYPINPATDVYANYDINSPTLGYQPRAYAPNYRIPERVTTYTASVEQRLPGQVQVMVGYVGSVGRNLFLRSITNLITGVTTNPTTGPGTPIRQFGGRFAEIDYKTSGGTDMYNALQTSFQRRFSHGLSFGGQYTWAKELGTTSGSNEATTAQNPYDFRTEYGRGIFDIRHSLNATALYELPFGHGKAYSLSGPMDILAGGWQVGSIVNFRSGLPIDVLITRPDVAYVGNPGTSIAGQTFASPVITAGVFQTTAVVNTPGGGNSRNIRRPDVVPGVNPYTKSGIQYLNPAAFSTPAPGTFGNYRRNDLSGPNLAQFDFTLGKTFRATERASFVFRADIYNILNHPNYANPGTVRLNQTLTSGAANQPGAPFSQTTAGSAWGRYSSSVGNQVGLGANRQIQLSLRANF
jgi:hypothetical protein